MKPTLYLCDDHRIFVQSMEAFIKQDGTFDWVGSGLSVAEAKADILYLKPDLILVDYHLKESDGTELIRWVRSEELASKVVVLTMRSDGLTRTTCKKAGANGFFPKEMNAVDLIGALQQVLAAPYEFHDGLSGLQEEEERSRPHPYGLTKREYHIAKLVCEGLTSQEIASLLYLSKLTVDTHRKSIMQKTAAANVVELLKKLGL
jgi:DNA-binding NarL/FixJ family response regulator